MAKQEGKTEKNVSANDRISEIVSSYWRLILTSLALGLGLYLFIHLSPWIGITVPIYYYMPTIFMIGLAYVMDKHGEPMMKLTYALFTGFLFLVIITLITPYLVPYFPYFTSGG